MVKQTRGRDGALCWVRKEGRLNNPSIQLPNPLKAAIPKPYTEDPKARPSNDLDKETFHRPKTRNADGNPV